MDYQQYRHYLQENSLSERYLVGFVENDIEIYQLLDNNYNCISYVTKLNSPYLTLFENYKALSSELKYLGIILNDDPLDYLSSNPLYRIPQIINPELGELTDEKHLNSLNDFELDPLYWTELSISQQFTRIDFAINKEIEENGRSDNLDKRVLFLHGYVYYLANRLHGNVSWSYMKQNTIQSDFKEPFLRGEDFTYYPYYAIIKMLYFPEESFSDDYTFTMEKLLLLSGIPIELVNQLIEK